MGSLSPLSIKNSWSSVFQKNLPWGLEDEENEASPNFGSWTQLVGAPAETHLRPGDSLQATIVRVWLLH